MRAAVVVVVVVVVVVEVRAAVVVVVMSAAVVVVVSAAVVVVVTAAVVVMVVEAVVLMKHYKWFTASDKSSLPSSSSDGSNPVHRRRTLQSWTQHLANGSSRSASQQHCKLYLRDGSAQTIGRADNVAPGAWQGGRYGTSWLVTGMTGLRSPGIDARAFRFSRRASYRYH